MARIDKNTTQQQELEKTYSIISKKLLKGVSRESCIKYLVKTGVPREFASDFVDKAVTDTDNFKKSPNYRNFLINLAIQRLVTGVSWILMAIVLNAVYKSPVSYGFSIAMILFGSGYIFIGGYAWIKVISKKY